MKRYQNSNGNLFDFLSKLVQEQHEPISDAVFAKLFFTCAYHVNNERELGQLVKIIQALSVDIEGIEQYENISRFLTKLSEGRFSTIKQMEDQIHLFIPTEQKGRFRTHDAVFALFQQFPLPFLR